MEKTKSAGVIQRISAAVFDLMIAFILSTLLSSFVIGPLFTSSDRYKENYEIFESGLISTSMYVKDENNSNKLTCIIDKVNEKGELLFTVDNLDVYETCLVDFYTNYSQEEVDKYQDTKKNVGFYLFDETNKIYVVDKNKVTMTDAYNFFAQSFIDATNYFLDQNKAVGEAFYYLNLTNNYATITSFGIGLLICFIIIPLFMKNGETLAKKAFSLSVKSVKKDKPLSKLQITIREVAYVGVVVVLSLFTYMIPAVISIVFMIFNKNHLSLHDYVAQTYVVDNLKEEIVEENNKDNIIDVEVKEVNE